MNEEQLEHLKNVSYKELTHEQKEDFKDYFSNEEEFENVKELFLGIQDLKSNDEYPGDHIKDNLDKAFDSKYKKESLYRRIVLFLFPPMKPLIMRPAFQISLASLLLLFGVYLWNSFQSIETTQSKKVYVSQNDNPPKPSIENTNTTDSMLNKTNGSQEDDTRIPKKEFLAENEDGENSVLPPVPIEIYADMDIDMAGTLSAELIEEESEVVAMEDVDVSFDISRNIHSVSKNIELLDVLCATY